MPKSDGKAKPIAAQSKGNGQRVAARLGLSEGEGVLAPPHFSPREQQVLALLARGMSNKQIAAELGLTYLSIKQYCKQVYRKLNVPNRTAAALWAVKHLEQGTSGK